jgi:RimJ/RimL family protein N-acetyltransferase
VPEAMGEEARVDPDVVATGGRVALRRWRDSDVPEVVGACQDPEIQRWTTVPVPYTTQDAVDYGTCVAADQWRDGSGAPLALVGHPGGELVGSMSVLSFDDGVAAVGYWTAPARRGRGLTAEGLRLLAAWCFAERGVARVELEVEPGNAASRAVAARAGFTEEGTLRQRALHRGRRIDVVLCSLLPTDPAAPGAVR